jgi:hypothetical protein
MGLGNRHIHLGSPSRKQIRQHLDRLKPNWLTLGARHMANAVTQDWQEWKKSM